MSRKVITAGDKFTEIDSLACALAYKELMDQSGKKSVVVLPGAMNVTVTPAVKNWGLVFETAYTPEKTDSFIIVDVSDPAYIARFVDRNKISLLLDHHFGHEEYWQKKLGDRAVIQHIGACATLIWEEYVKSNHQNHISNKSANLLCTAILSNTLNFQAGITSDRDRLAHSSLITHASLNQNWAQEYFQEISTSASMNIKESLINDTKELLIRSLGKKCVISQLELLHSRDFINEHKSIIRDILEGYDNPLWLLTSPSVGEGKNYFFTTALEIKQLLSKKLDVSWSGDTGSSKKIYLRKEIMHIIN